METLNNDIMTRPTTKDFFDFQNYNGINTNTNTTTNTNWGSSEPMTPTDKIIPPGEIYKDEYDITNNDAIGSYDTPLFNNNMVDGFNSMYDDIDKGFAKRQQQQQQQQKQQQQRLLGSPFEYCSFDNDTTLVDIDDIDVLELGSSCYNNGNRNFNFESYLTDIDILQKDEEEEEEEDNNDILSIPLLTNIDTISQSETLVFDDYNSNNNNNMIKNNELNKNDKTIIIQKILLNGVKRIKKKKKKLYIYDQNNTKNYNNNNKDILHKRLLQYYNKLIRVQQEDFGNNNDNSNELFNIRLQEEEKEEEENNDDNDDLLRIQEIEYRFSKTYY